MYCTYYYRILLDKKLKENRQTTQGMKNASLIPAGKLPLHSTFFIYTSHFVLQ